MARTYESLSVPSTATVTDRSLTLLSFRVDDDGPGSDW